MKILVTGATGFIGFHLIPRLLSAGHLVCGLTRYSNMQSNESRRRWKKLEELQSTYKERLQFLACEDVQALPGAFKKIQPDVCVHLAGRSWVRESIGYPDLYEEANYRTTVGVLEGLRLAGCRRVVFASSVMVYGKDATLPYNEKYLGGPPASPYGASKLACEVLLNTYRVVHKLETVNLRLFSVYGPEMRPDCVPFLIASAILKGQPFTIFGDGSSVRDYIEIVDVLGAIEAAVLQNESHDALNIGTGSGTSMLELVRSIEQALGKKVDLVYKPAIPGELLVAIPDISMAMEMLKWKPIVGLPEGIDRMVAWMRSLACHTR